jgi:hypothetical protein
LPLHLGKRLRIRDFDPLWISACFDNFARKTGRAMALGASAITAFALFLAVPLNVVEAVT